MLVRWGQPGPRLGSGSVSGSAMASRTQTAVGTAVHGAVAELAAVRGEMSVATLLRVAGSQARAVSQSEDVRVGAQHVAPLAAVAVRLFPPSGWELVGDEVVLGHGRADLVWRSPTHEVVVDELKVAGLGRVVEDRATRDQLERHRSGGVAHFGDLFVGVRLLVLAGPLRSRFYPPWGRWRPLDQTPWWFGFGEELR